MMPDNDFLHPFRALSPSHRREVARQRHQASEARQREQRVLEAYRTLVGDPRYVAIKDELAASLGATLHQLVNIAASCNHCAPVAVRVKALNDLVAEPLHRLFDEAQKSRLEVEPVLVDD